MENIWGNQLLVDPVEDNRSQLGNEEGSIHEGFNPIALHEQLTSANEDHFKIRELLVSLR
jgi:hypothetical protein